MAAAAAALAATSSAGCVSAAATCSFLHKSLPLSQRAAVARSVIGTRLPALHMPRIVCSAEERKVNVDEKKTEVSSSSNGFSCSQLMVAMSTASALTAAHPALALVDERLSTEGTGLGLGLSNSKLTWILVGVTTLIWVLYFVYSTDLPEGDDDSGLSL
jgi:photosystem II PsbW protein